MEILRNELHILAPDKKIVNLKQNVLLKKRQFKEKIR